MKIQTLLRFVITLMMSLFLFTGAMAQTTRADIKSNLIENLQRDGYLSEKLAREAAAKYVSAEDATVPVAVPQASGGVNWTQYLSWVNFIKVAASILLLVALSGFIKIIIASAWFLITRVPVIVYQGVMLSGSIVGTLWPEAIWASQAFYIALFCSFANLLILGWIATSYKAIGEFLAKVFNFGIPVSTVLSFWAMVYFGALAVAYQSSIFGFFAAVALSGIFTFTLMYVPGILFLSFKENALPAMVLGHIGVLALYVGIYQSGLAQPYIGYFNAGIQYYCSVALGVGLLVGASPFYKPSQAIAYGLLFVVVVAAASVLYFFLGMTTIATTLFIFFALVFLEWMGYMGFKGGWVVGCASIGGMLYGLGLVLETHGAGILHKFLGVMA